MKAIVYHEYGSPDNLKRAEIEKPTPNEGELLVKVRAASVNPAEWHSVRGTPWMARVETGLLKPKNPILGADIAGQIEAVGSGVTQFQPGDEIFGRSRFGGYAEYVCVPENRMAHKPANLSFEEAAAVPLAALTALQALRKGKIQQGQTVLINGASGGIGTIAVQLAKHYGAEVTAVCSTRNLQLVQSIGANHVIDYTQENLPQIGRRYDLILDAVGNLTVADYKRLLGPNGICVVIGFENPRRLFQVMFKGSWASLTGSIKITLMNANTNSDDLEFVRELIEAGKVVPVIDRSYPFQQIPEALWYLGKKHARGKVVITFGKNGSSG